MSRALTSWNPSYGSSDGGGALMPASPAQAFTEARVRDVLSGVPQVERPDQMIDPRRGQAELGRDEPEFVRDGLPGVQHAVADPPGARIGLLL